MKISRHFTSAGESVFDTVEWTKRSSRISNLDGSVVFEMDDAEVPAAWSQLATDIMVSKYFRKAGVPQTDPNDSDQAKPDASQSTGPERSVRQVIHRLAGCWRHFGEAHGYFDTTEDGQAFYDELCHMLVHQMCAPNSPQWFNTGLHWSYGINGPAQGHYYTDPATGQTKPSEDAYAHPQPHACFIQSLQDDLVNPGGIMDLWVREARLFKYGSGTGTNFSQLRGEDEPLSGGGRSSGLMSFLKIGDRAAGAIKSGGTTRRAAKMVCLDLDHPDVEAFINWKVREELKVAALVAGLKHLDPKQRQAAEQLDLTLDHDFNGEAYQTVSGQNSNNSVRVPNRFFEFLANNQAWELTARTDGQVLKTVPAADLWDQIASAAWHCADPGVQFDNTINQWHTCSESGRIHASNPCSEYMFLDNTACNLASLNLLAFYDASRRHFDVVGFEHAIRLWTMVLEISVLMAQYPSEEIARLSYRYRTLGLGYANLGALLMQAAIPYDSDRARSICATLTAILTGRSYATSAEMAQHLEPYPGMSKNQQGMLRVIRNHRRAAYGVPREGEEESGSSTTNQLGSYEDLQIPPVPIDSNAIGEAEDGFGALANSETLVQRARECWDDALDLGEQFGFRNAQTTVLAPTGTIGLLMDCDTTGVEPDFALVKFKKLAGGGYFKIANQSLRPALETLGYTEEQIRAILTYVMGTLSLDVPLPKAKGSTDSNQDDTSPSFADWLMDRGFTREAIDRLTDGLPTIFELPFAFSPLVLGRETLERLGFTEQAEVPGFNLLEAMGLKEDQIRELNLKICGTQTVEGAPELAEEHLAVFDCANPPRADALGGKRFIAADGHIRMMAAAQPFISGAISKTINLPNSASIEDIKSAYRLSWELGLKAIALYRDGCKLSQPLAGSLVDDQDEDEDEESIEAAKAEVAAEVADLADRAALIESWPTPAVDGDQVQTVEKVVERIVHRPMRRRLDDTRRSVTHKFYVAGHEGYLTVGLYDDGSPGELFITMAKEGSTIGGLMDSLGTAISVALQYGVPVESLVNKFTHQRFEPAGVTHNRDIPFAKSLVDYIFRWLGMEFVSGYRSANAPSRSTEPAPIDQADSESAKSKQIDEPANGTNGNGANHVGTERSTSATRDRNLMVTDEVAPSESVQALDLDSGQGAASLAIAMKEIQEDAPACDVCGTITVRNGTCYKCMNCGNAMECG